TSFDIELCSTVSQNECMGSFPRPLSHPLSKGPTPRVPIVRAMEFEFDAGQIPRHWFMGNAHLTALANALQLLFPEGERFFIRALRHYEDRIKDPLLYRRMRAFYGQEGRHGQAHERFFRVLEAQGYEIRSFLEWYKGVAYARIESSHRRLCDWPQPQRLSILRRCLGEMHSQAIF
ncbi:MAG: metal-dependent hydrolase, partial [Deltaproteobacteria bacterium]|nr:metal-dependent hydrolase [Deltaproteobacteria bacterium]